MQILSEVYKLTEINNMAFEKVPRGSFISETSRIALDYHADLCNLKVGENVKIELFISEKPLLNRNVYLMRGIVYKIEENKFEASFGGLLLFYEGLLNENLSIESELFVAVSKV